MYSRTQKATRRRPLAVALLLLVVLCGGAGLLAMEQPPTSPPQEGFVPIDELPADEQLPAAPLLVAAYTVAWVAVFGYLWSIWRRLARVERELADVSRRIEAGGRR